MSNLRIEAKVYMKGWGSHGNSAHKEVLPLLVDEPLVFIDASLVVKDMSEDLKIGDDTTLGDVDSMRVIFPSELVDTSEEGVVLEGVAPASGVLVEEAEDVFVTSTRDLEPVVKGFADIIEILGVVFT